MADYTDTRLKYGKKNQDVLDDPFINQDVVQHEKNLEVSRGNASVAGKVTAFSDIVSQNNMAADIITDSYSDSVAKEFAPDDAWQANGKFDDEGLDTYMSENGIPHRYRKKLDGASSQAEFTFLELGMQREVAIDKSIDEHVGSDFRRRAGMASAFLGVETLMFGAVGKMYTTGTKLAKVAAYEGVAEALYVGGQFATDEDYDITDVPTDILLGLGASVGMAGVAKKFKLHKHRKTEAEVTELNTVNVDKSAKMNMETGAVEPRGDDITPVIHGKKGIQGAFESTSNLNKKDTDKLAKLEREMEEIDKVSEGRGKRDYRKQQIAKLKKKVAKQSDELSKLEKKMQLDDKTLDIETKAEELNMQESLDELVGMSKTAEDDITFKKAKEDVLSKHPELNGIDDIKTADDIETFKDKVKKATTLSRKQQIAIISTLALTGTSLSADEGDGMVDVGTALSTVIIGSIIGYNTWRAYRSGNAKDWMRRSQARISKNIDESDVANSQEGKTGAKVREYIAEGMHTKLTSTLAGFTGKAEKIMSKLLWSAKTGWGSEMQKLMDIKAHAAMYQGAEDKAFKLWAKANNVESTNSIFMDSDLKDRFREELMDFMEDRTKATDGFGEFADEIDGLMKQMYDKNKAYGTHGFDKVDYIKGMMPRLWKTGNINNILGQLGDTDLSSVKKAFAKAIHKGDIEHRAKQVYDPKKKEPKPITMADSEAKAERLVQGWKDMPLKDASRLADDSLTAVTQYLRDDVDLEDVLKSLAQQKNAHSRTQHRLNVDTSILKDELSKITVDGKSLNMNMFLDRNVKNVFDKTSNQLHSSSAMSSAGYTSKQQLIDEINRSGATKKQKEEMLQVADLMNGNVPNINSDVMHNFSLIAKDLMVATKLPLSPIATFQEVSNMVGIHGLTKSMRELGKNHSSLLRNDDKLTKQLQDLTGQGTNTKRYDPTHQGYSDDVLGSEDVDVTSSIRNGTMKMRDVTLLGLGYATDMIQGAALKLDGDMLSKKLLDMEEFGSYRWDGVGISDDIKSKFVKEDFVFKDGRLESINMSGWSFKKKDEFRGMLFNMNQRISLEQTLGESPLFSKTSDLGRAMTGLLGYSIGELNVHKIQDIRHMDRIAFSHSVAAFGAVYATTYARAGLNGKEVDEDTVLRYAIMAAVPPLAAISLAKSAFDPAMFDAPKTAMNILATGSDR